MCGLTGYWSDTGNPAPEHDQTIRRMASAIVHRGPDDDGYWVDEVSGIALGFRRLAILDVSSAGHQPMFSQSGRYAIAFNGEMYNFRSVRHDLERVGHRFVGGSDTEVILAAVEEWGLPDAISRFIGMFAIALWDRRERCLHLVRDRFGIKPMYYGWSGDVLLFGSELKAIAAHPAFTTDVDPDALTLFMRYGYVPSPYCIFRGLHKAPAASIMTFHAASQRVSPTVRTFWSPAEMAADGTAHPFEGSDDEAVDELERLLAESVGLHMVSDVPLGAFLSGGIDSSTIVALMQQQSDRPVKTFSIGFHEADHNEADHAARVARHLGTEHTELYVSGKQAMDLVPRIPDIFDEPMSDASQIPTYIVSDLARRDVTVALSGDGGDELFAGYHRYFDAHSIWERVNRVPAPARRMAAHSLAAVSSDRWDRALNVLRPVLPGGVRDHVNGRRIQKFGDVLSARSPDDVYLDLVSHWKQPEQVVVDGREPSTLVTDRAKWPHLPNYIERMMYLDLVTYMPDQILAKVDRASMAVSLEVRVPILNQHIAEFAWRLPLSMKLRDGKGKWALRQVLHRHVPQDLIERRKMGFSVPLGAWLRGDLRDWVEDVLSESNLRDHGLLQPEPIRRAWHEHLSGQRNWQWQLWNVIVFQEWHARWCAGLKPEPAIALTGD